MIQLNFKHKEMEKLYRDENYHDRRLPPNLRKSYVKKCFILETLATIQDLNKYKGLNFELYEEHYSIRINQQWRIEFDYDTLGNITIIEIIDANNHYQPNFNK